MPCYENFKKKIVHNFLINAEKANIKNVKIVNRIATLRTIEVLLEKKISIERHNHNPENLFKIYLLVNDEIANREKMFFSKYFSKKRSKENEIRLHLYLGLNQHIINQDLANKKLWVEALKFVQYEKWVTTDVNIEKALKKYLNRFNVNTLYELFSIIFEIGKIAINHHKFKVENHEQIAIIQTLDLEFVYFFPDKSSVENNDDSTPAAELAQHASELRYQLEREKNERIEQAKEQRRQIQKRLPQPPVVQFCY